MALPRVESVIDVALVVQARDLRHPAHRDHPVTEFLVERTRHQGNRVMVSCDCRSTLYLYAGDLADARAAKPVNVIREAMSSLPPPPAPASRSSIIAGLGLLQQAAEAIEEDMKKKLHEQWAREYTGEWGVDLSLPPSGPAMVPPPVDRSAPKQWPIGRYIEENDKLRARAAKAEKEREAALVAARSAQERLDARSDAVVRLAEAQRTIAVQKGNIATLDDELKAARARPLEWRIDPTKPPPMKVRWGGFAPPVYGTVQVTAKELEASRGCEGVFVPANELEEIEAVKYSRPEGGPSAVASAPGIAPKRRARPYHQAVLYCQNEED